jgi:hypothetical protein
LVRLSYTNDNSKKKHVCTLSVQFELLRTNKKVEKLFLALKIMLAIFRVCFLISISYVAAAQEVKLMKSTMGTSASGIANLVTGSVSINHTIGQSSNINHFSSGQLHLLQGFQHPFLLSCTACGFRAVSMSIYPNPSQGILLICMERLL